MTKHIMVDLETLGLRPFPVILSIGAVRFDPYASEVPSPLDANERAAEHGFYQVITMESCLELGATIDDNTFRWWMEPEQAIARRYSMWMHESPQKPVHLRFALEMFSAWVALEAMPDAYRDEHSGEYIWSHGILPDLGWLGAAYNATGKKWPFHFRNARDTRTLYDLADPWGKDDGLEFPHAPVKHHPTCDAWAQARAVQQCYSVLKTPVPVVLFCPNCGLRHVDAPDPTKNWTNPPHRSHLCAHCGIIWRPSPRQTVGVPVTSVRPGKDDTFTARDQVARIA